MKSTLLNLTLALTVLTTLISCDSKETVALAVATETIGKAIPVEVGACDVDSIQYDRTDNSVAMTVAVSPLYTESKALGTIAPADARKEVDLMLRTSELTGLLVPMVNAKATLHVQLTYGGAPAVTVDYTPEQLKALSDAPQLTANEYASQSMALNLSVLTGECPRPFLLNTMSLERASVADSVITYEITPVSAPSPTGARSFSEINADQTAFRKELLRYITESYEKGNRGWATLIEDAWELDRTLCFKVKDPVSSRTVTFDFPARSSLYWIINPK